jgi:hypothetical protein
VSSFSAENQEEGARVYMQLALSAEAEIQTGIEESELREHVKV